MLAVDTSHLAQPRVVTVQEWSEIASLGYELAIVCAHAGSAYDGINPYARESLFNARSANMLTATYITIRPRAARQVVQEGRNNLGPEWEFCRFAAVDCEWSETLSVQDVVDGVTAVEELNKAAWIYTGLGYWRDKMGNPTLPIALPLWDASYGQKPSLDMQPPYGGWTRRAAHQYAGDASLVGIKVDVSLFDDAVLEASMPDTDEVALLKQQLDNANGAVKDALRQKDYANALKRYIEDWAYKHGLTAAEVDQFTKEAQAEVDATWGP